MEFLKGIVPDKIAAILADEEASVEAKTKAFKKWHDESSEIATDRAIADFKKSYEEEFGREVYEKATAAIKNRLKKLGGFTSSEVSQKSALDLLDLVDAKFEEKLKDAASGKEAELVKKINTLEEKLQERDEDVSALQGKIEEKEKEVDRKIREFRVSEAKMKRFSQVNWDDPAKEEVYVAMLNQKLEGISIDPETLEIKNADGTKVKAPDDSAIWKNLDDAIAFYTEKYKMTKKSNGGGGGKPPRRPGDGGDDGRRIDTSKVFGGARALAEKLGVENYEEPEL